MITYFLESPYTFSIGAISIFIFLIPIPGKAISAMASFMSIIVPIPYCGCLMRSPMTKSEAECFFFDMDGFA